LGQRGNGGGDAEGERRKIARKCGFDIRRFEDSNLVFV
jgi:hypothetical protein